MDSYDDCFDAVTSATPEDGGPFYSFTWHSPQFGGGYGGHCYGVRDFSWQPVLEGEIDSGRLIGSNIYSNVVKNSKSFADGTFYGLRVNNNRGIRARYPDQIPEIGMQYDPLSGWITDETNWIDPIPTENATDIIINKDLIDGPVTWPMDGPGGTPWTGEGDWGNFWLGLGGPCNNTNKLGKYCTHCYHGCFLLFLLFLLFSLCFYYFFGQYPCVNRLFYFLIFFFSLY